MGAVIGITVATDGTGLPAYLKSRAALAGFETVADPRFREAVRNGDIAGAGDAALDHTIVGDGRSFKQCISQNLT